MIPLVVALSLGVSMPEMPSLPQIKRDPQITYLDRGGALIGVRGGRYAPPTDLARLPAYVPAAFVAIEDRRFYEHSGIDPMGVARALLNDIGQGRATQGASTITQQLARNLFLTNERTVERKATEAVYAVELEQTYSKQQILGLYLSRVYFGSGAYGIEAAAHRYYNKPAAKLTVREAASLAAIMKSPTNYDPADQPEASAARTRLVLDAMVETGAITPAQRTKALAQTPKVWKEAPAAAAQYFVDWVDGQTRRLLASPIRGDLVVETTLDMALETAAAQAAAATVARHDKQGVQQAAVVSVDAAGHVRALVGGVDYQHGPFDRAVDAHRQAGSAWKPFVYLAAMESGRTPDTMVVDEPVTISGWSPHNFEDGFLGPITLQTALAQSINTVAARLADDVGRDKVAAAAHRAGIVSPINTDPAMALGTSLMTPLEMAQAYNSFSNGGNRVAAYGIERIKSSAGALIFQNRLPPPAPAIANPPLGELNQMLRQVVATGTGARAAIRGYDIAGKTGTTSDFKDAWFCGFTGGLTTVVWMGRDDNSSMRGITGGSAPAEAWHTYMAYAVKRISAQPIPLGPPAPVVTPPVPAPDQTPPDAQPPIPGLDQLLPPGGSAPPPTP